MPICTICRKFYHPDFIIYVDEGISKCLFCELGKNVLTIKDKKTGRVVEKVKKEDASREYHKMLKRLADQEKIAELLVKDDKQQRT